MKRLSAAAIIASAALAIAGCSNTQADGGGEDGIGPTNTASGNGNPAGGATIPNNSFRALYVPSGGIIPYPNDAYFSGSTDGTLNIPAGTLFPNATTVNRVDGFSVSASNTIRFSEPLGTASLTSASVRVIETTMVRDAASGAYLPIGGVRRVLIQDVDYTLRAAPEIDAAGTVLEVVPLKPFTSSTGTGTGVGYVVLVTSAVRNASGIAASPDTDYQAVRNEAIAEIGRAGTNPAYSPTCPGITNAQLNSACRLTFVHLRIGGALPAPLTINPANVVVSYSFTTQATRYVLEQIAAVTTANPIRAVPTGRTTAQVLPGARGLANVFAGTLQIPYYMTPPSAAAPTAPLTRNWTAAGAPVVVPDATSREITRFNPIPAKVADLNIPLLVAVPNASAPGGGVKPVGGWPVVVFQHGLGGNRTNMLFIADAYASAGIVVVAIDQWFHGITDTANSLYAGPANPAATALYGAGTRERTFDVDYVNNTTFAPGPDGRIDPSGLPNLLIAGLQNPLVIRDGLRQSGTDLIALVKSLPSLDLDLNGTPDIDATKIHYAGHSLGGIVGPACVCEQVQSFYLNVPGGSFPEIARTSPSFAPLVNSALAGVNPLLQPNTSLYAQFFREWQLAIDAGDPISLIGRLAQDRPVLLTKVVGDTTVPNPTNDNLIRAASLTKVTQAGVVPVARGAGKFITFIQGEHSSLLNPTRSLAVTTEMQSQAVSFAASGGTVVQVTNGAILEP